MYDLHLKVFADRSELVRSGGGTEVFVEGPTDEKARARYQRIKTTLADGYLEEQIRRCREEPGTLALNQLSLEQTGLLDKLVSSMNSENGRAIIGLTILQLCVKSIEPAQSVRLHKGGTSRNNFSWRDGISMRSLDSNYITPKLREHDLLRLNKDGFMMTRSLAENYPYSQVYKAWIRGARSQWAAIVEGVEAGELNAESALHYVLSQLLNAAGEFRSLADTTLEILEDCKASGKLADRRAVARVIEDHVTNSDYRARIMEIAMHSLVQALEVSDALGNGTLEPLSQIRSANKKHGNIGDIEIFEENQIVESWDAKYGKTYLRDELEELNDKLALHPWVRLAGFVTNEEPERLEELESRRADIEFVHDVSIQIISLEGWVDEQFERALSVGLVNEGQLAECWITAYVESLSLRRLEKAPIDEPCYQWLAALRPILEASCR